jgi:hypothetical protein
VNDPRGVEAIIREAMRRGDFDQLAGKGKPIDLQAYFDTPEDVRLAYAMLKETGFLPTEVETLKDIEALEEKLAATADEEQQARLRKQVEDARLKFNLMMERLRRKPARSRKHE